MSVFTNTSEALIVGLVLGAAFMVFVYMGYQLLLTEVKREIRERVKERIDNHKEIYHKD